MTQINLQHCIAASALLSRRIATMHTNPQQQQLVLIQEPWVSRKRICGLSIRGANLLWPNDVHNPRTCIVAKGMEVVLLRDLSSRDITVAKIAYQREGITRQALAVSLYLPYDSLTPPPSREMREVIGYASQHGLEIIIGCDANSHNTIWGSNDTNRRGEALLEFLASTELEVLNRGNEPTFVTPRRQEVIDITLCSRGMVSEISGWKVAEEDTLSDHKYIEFCIGADRTPAPMFRNPKRANWHEYREGLRRKLRASPCKLRSPAAIDAAVHGLVKAMNEAFEAACPISKPKNTNTVPWWNNELGKTRRAARRLLKKARKSRLEADWQNYKSTQRNYKKLVRKAKRESYRAFTEGIDKTRVAARLIRILKRDPAARLDSLKRPDGTFTSTKEEAHRLLLETHFPGCLTNVSGQGDGSAEEEVHYPSRSDWVAASKIINQARVKWAIASFDSFKSPGPDNVYPAMLKEGVEMISPHLEKIYTACLATGYIPVQWRAVRVAFIPKPGKTTYTDAKSFRTISLTSFLLKGMEKLMDRHIRDQVLKRWPLHASQHAYQRGRSTETALHDLVCGIEGELDKKGHALGAFLDIEGAFDNATFDSLCCAASTHGVNETSVRWIRKMLEGRILQTEVGKDIKLSAKVMQGCPQGGVLSPLLWCMLVNSLLSRLNGLGFRAQGYADDISILTCGAGLGEVYTSMQAALDVVEEWCDHNGLRVNPAKTTLVLFTRKRRLPSIATPTIYNQALGLSPQVKYLGVTLDSKLSWGRHVEQRVETATKVFWQCRRAFGNSWGLKPKMVHWLYTSIIRPYLTYAAVVWWPRTKVRSTISRLDKIQRLATVGITGAMRTTPSAALNILLALAPLDLIIQEEARKAVIRLKASNQWNVDGVSHGHCQMEETLFKECPSAGMPSDRINPIFEFCQRYSVITPTRQEWEQGNYPLDGPSTTNLFTDGSLTEEGAGAGVYTSDPADNQLSFSLGSYCTVFQAEVFALMKAAELMIGSGRSGGSINLYSDSQAALAALNNPLTTSNIVGDCKRLLNVLGRGNCVRLIWVPGHTGVVGNEKADEQAREGACTPFQGPEPALGVSYTMLRGMVRESCHNMHVDRWRGLSGCRQTKLFFREVSEKRTKFILSLPRRQCKDLVGIITGHCRLRKHLCRIGVADDETCRFCSEEDETATHVLCECPALWQARLNVFGCHPLNEEQLTTTPLNKVLTFIKRTACLQCSRT